MCKEVNIRENHGYIKLGWDQNEEYSYLIKFLWRCGLAEAKIWWEATNKRWTLNLSYLDESIIAIIPLVEDFVGEKFQEALDTGSAEFLTFLLGLKWVD